jgi:hypothetical protein
MLRKHHGSHFPQCCRLQLVVPFGCQTLSKRCHFSFIFNLGNRAK